MSKDTNATPITPLSGNWLITLAMYRAVLAAGFTASPIKSMEGNDGPHWQVTLSRKRVKVIEASNGGFGGPDEVGPVYDQKIGIEACKTAYAEAHAALAALPEVKTFLLAHLIDVASFEDDEKVRAAAVAEILAKNEVKFDDDNMGHVIATLGEVRKCVPKLKKELDKGLAYVPATYEFPDYKWYRGFPDTPANRKHAQEKFKDAFQGFQGFMGDLLEGL